MKLARELCKAVATVAVYAGLVLGTALFLTAPASATTIFDNPAFAVEEHPYGPDNQAQSFFLFFAQPGYSIGHIAFTAPTDVQPLLPFDNAAFFISGPSGDDTFNLVSAPPEAARLHTLALDQKADLSLWLRSTYWDIDGIEGDIDEIGPGWYTSSMGSLFPFPPLAFRFVEAHVINGSDPGTGTVPEPGMLALMGIGLLGMWGVRRFK